MTLVFYKNDLLKPFPLANHSDNKNAYYNFINDKSFGGLAGYPLQVRQPTKMPSRFGLSISIPGRVPAQYKASYAYEDAGKSLLKNSRAKFQKNALEHTSLLE